jgi:hypothetical protein
LKTSGDIGFFVNIQEHLPGLFTSQDCYSGKEVIHEAVLEYCEWITTKPM